MKGARKLLPRTRKTVIRPLATSAKNEAITTELNDALYDFLAQLGQTSEHHNPKVIFVGGDGLTYEKIIGLKRARQFYDSPYDRMDNVKAFLENWHAELTHLTLEYGTHWGDSLSQDPSKLGHSATKIGQKGPSNLKKVDYYPSIYLAYLVADARMIDIWRIHYECDDLLEYMASLEKDNRLPSLDELEKTARQLYRAYSSLQAYHCALRGDFEHADREMKIPHGQPWVPLPTEQLVSNTTSQKKTKKKKTTNDDEPVVPYRGDQVLAHSILFLRDTIISREMALAVPEGDVGRVYEALKVMMFQFAGSTHTKYMSYLLEQICDLEYECTEAVKDYFMENWLINPSGAAGGYKEGDIHQERHNLELQSMMNHKNMEWDSTFCRQVISPNIDKLLEVKNTLGQSVGLAKRRKAHTAPHSNPEYNLLLRAYKEDELHLFRPGRHYTTSTSLEDLDIDTFGRGYRELQGGKLKKWINQTTKLRLMNYGDVMGQIGGANDENSDDEEEGEEDEEEEPFRTHGSAVLVNGELVIEYDMTEDEHGVLVNEAEMAAREDSDAGWETDDDEGVNDG